MQHNKLQDLAVTILRWVAVLAFLVLWTHSDPDSDELQHPTRCRHDQHHFTHHTGQNPAITGAITMEESQQDARNCDNCQYHSMQYDVGYCTHMQTFRTDALRGPLMQKCRTVRADAHSQCGPTALLFLQRPEMNKVEKLEQKRFAEAMKPTPALDIPFCINCQFIESPDHNPTCGNRETMQICPVNGPAKISCHLARRPKARCGYFGQLFIARDPAPDHALGSVPDLSGKA